MPGTIRSAPRTDRASAPCRCARRRRRGRGRRPRAGRSREAELLLDAERGGIVDEDAGTDVAESDAGRHRREAPAGLGGVAPAPVGAAKPVAELARPADARQADAADQRASPSSVMRAASPRRPSRPIVPRRLGVGPPIGVGHAGEHRSPQVVHLGRRCRRDRLRTGRAEDQPPGRDARVKQRCRVAHRGASCRGYRRPRTSGSPSCGGRGRNARPARRRSASASAPCRSRGTGSRTSR